MNARNIQRTRTNGWRNSFAASVGLTASTRTDDPLLSVVTAPMPTLVIRFGGKSAMSFGVARGAPPAPPAIDRPPEPASGEQPSEQSSPAPAPDSAGEQSSSAPAPDSAGEPVAAEAQENPQPPVDQPEETAGAGSAATAEATAEPQEVAEVKPEEASDAKSAEPQQPAPAEATKPAGGSNRIELIIDSLPSHPLIEPIPVVIDPLGDEMFTASMRDLEMAATGNSIGEALLFLKEQIDSTFDDLTRRSSHLTHDQKTTLQRLHTYIAAQPQPKSRWF